MDQAELRKRFESHELDDDQTFRSRDVRGSIRLAAEDVNDFVPAGREQSLALTHLEEALFWANAGIAREKA